MGSFFDQLFGREKKSANQAKERLKFVLIHDRTDLSPGALDMMKDEIIAVISRYVQIDAEAMQIGVEHNGREQRLVADIPLKPAGRRRRS